MCYHICMKKSIVLILISIFISAFACAFEATVYEQNNKFGLIGENGEIITDAKYSKLIRLRDESHLFLYKGKYGIISNDGKILVEPKYTQAQRFIGKFARLGLRGKYAIYDNNGDMIVDREYSNIELLYGGMFLVKKNFKYGLISFDGDIILAPVADDIYMPQKNILKILYDGVWYAIEQKNKEALALPDDILMLNSEDFSIMQFIEQPIIGTGYGLVSMSDYIIKLFSSVSPAYEQTIDELLFDYGADTGTLLIHAGWLFKFPFVYGKNYFNTFKAPNNGPLSDIKTNLKRKITNSN